MARPIPDQEIVRRAYAVMLRDETEIERYLREEWEAAIGGVRVALDAVRRLWPNEADFLGEDEGDVLQEACGDLAHTFARLDANAGSFIGDLMMAALHDELDLKTLEFAEGNAGITGPGKRRTHGDGSDTGEVTGTADDRTPEGESSTRGEEGPQA